MMNLKMAALATTVAFGLGWNAAAQAQTSPTKVKTENGVETPWRAIEAEPVTGGDLRSPSPKVFDQTRQGYFQAGAGPAFGMGFDKDDLMYNIQGAYNFNMDDHWSLKAIADLYMGAGSTISRMINVGAGGSFFFPNLTFLNVGVPYVTGEFGFGTARDNRNNSAAGLQVGGGTGFQFQANELNWDIGLHYALLTDQIDDRNPQVASLRAAVNF